MQTATVLRERDLLKPIASSPCVMIIVPFNIRLYPASFALQRIAFNIDLTQKRLEEHYSTSTTCNIIRKLKALVNTIFLSTDKKALVFCASEYDASMHYLDIDVKEHVAVGSSFRISDLLLSKEAIKKYLLLTLNEDEAILYLGSDHQISKLVVNSRKKAITDHTNATSDDPSSNEQQLGQFLRCVDNNLGVILKAYPLPLVLISTPQLKEWFTAVSKNGSRLVHHIAARNGEITGPDVSALMEPVLNNWSMLKEKALLQEISEAVDNKKCKTGIAGVVQAGSNINGRLLIIENRLLNRKWTEEMARGTTECANPHISDIDKLMERILFSGGDVEVVSDHLLNTYGGLALLM